MALLLAALAAQAQEPYPSRLVKFVVPLSAGGPLDVLARIAAQKLAEHWGKPVITENITGATGSIAASAVARAAPDGYTLFFAADIQLTMYPAVAKQLPYDPRADFKPVAIVARLTNALFVNSALNASTVAELIALARAQPGGLTFSSAGIASPGHFGGELFKTIAGIDMTHVPYKGAAPAMAAVVSGEVSLLFGPIAQGLPYLKSGKLRVLGVASEEPSVLLPGVKPLIEQGFAGLVATPWIAVMAPARTPEPVVNTIGAGLKYVFGDPGVRARLEAMGGEPLWLGPEQVARTIDADIRRWGELARHARIEAPQ